MSELDGSPACFTFVLVKGSLSIRVKALFLLLLFGLNIAGEYACASVMPMCKMASMKGNTHPGMCCCTKKGMHKDGGCRGEVVRVQQHQDKSLAALAGYEGPGWVLLVRSYYYSIAPAADGVMLLQEHRQHYYPPPPDIRVFIQSFQI